MRTAYSGRAAAYEKKGDYLKALDNHHRVVLFYAIEVEVLTDLEAPDRDRFLVEAAQAYRARGQCLEALGRQQAAEADRKRADGLERDARKLASQLKARESASGQVQFTNDWTQPVTLVVDGVSYRLEVGEHKSLPASAGSVAYEMQAGPYRMSGTVAAGKTYTIQAPAR
jgi:tetratricopeptide (TPR) repeat protein